MSSEAFIAQSMCKEILSKSSSGGMFAELAKHVLAKKGVVFGCAMERTQQAFEVKHICIDNENDLYKLQGSKYVQSYLGDSIKQAKYFLEQGFKVEAIDGSKELCRIASEYTGISVKHMFFQELSEVEKYDGIWACSSILHLSVEELAEVLQKMMVALKANGIIYTSFKYGTFEGERNGRYFTDMTEASFAELIKHRKELEIEEQWVTADVRPGRDEEKWLNLILRKSI